MLQMFGHVAKADGVMGLYRGVCDRSSENIRIGALTFE